MYKNGCLIILILLIILSGCSDTSMGSDSSYEKDPVEITSLTKGEILHEGSFLEIEYTVNEQETILNKLIISILNSEGEAVKEVVIEEEPLSEYIPEMEIEYGFPEGRYRLLLEFYNGDELFLSDEREFFITSESYYIKSITSYPPVLYPGGGGLFYADIESPADDCWLRWSLDGSEIASGMRSGGYQSIRIDAPENEGVYELSLEVFPLPPAYEAGYDYQSTVIDFIPVYVNTNQKSGVNEFGPEDDFYALFHFRGSLINSSETELTGVESLGPVGSPVLSVKNGVFGYYLDGSSGFESEQCILPVEDGSLQSFSLMFSLLPGSLEGLSSEQDGTGLFYSGTEDGSFSLAVNAFPDGSLNAVLTAGGEEFQLYSEIPLISADNYSSIGLSVHPEDGQLTLSWYLNGVPAADTVFVATPVLSTEVPWLSVYTDGFSMKTSFAGIDGFEGLIDELGIYYLHSEDGPAVDPGQYRRSMELEYGKFLMYAEGFDAESEDIILNPESASISGSSLIVAPGGEVVFPSVFPGYEEMVFSIVLTDSSTRFFEVVFNPDGLDDEIVRVDLASETDTAESVSFSLIFSPETVSVGETGAQDGETGYTGDFGGIVYRIINDDEIMNLEIESVLIIRKSINVSNAGLKETEAADGGKSDIITGVNISS